MQRMAGSIAAKIQPMAAHVMKCLERHRAAAAAAGGAGSALGGSPPLFVAFQGPQGSGASQFSLRLCCKFDEEEQFGVFCRKDLPDVSSE